MKRFARKELHKTGPMRFHLETNNLEHVDRFQDPHIVQMIKSYRHGRTFNIVFPCARTNLGRYLRETEYGTERLVNGIERSPLWQQLLGITKALKKIIENPIPIQSPIGQEREIGHHLDIKPENILIDDAGNFLISDFGQAEFRMMPENTVTQVTDMAGTEAYAPPEMRNVKLNLSNKYDLWSLGCVFLELTAFICGGHKGIEDFDKLRTSDTEDRFFEEYATGHFRVKPAIIRWMKILSETHEEHTTIRHLLAAIMALISKMLDVSAESRISIGGAYRELESILLHHGPDKVFSNSIQETKVEKEANECILGPGTLDNIRLASNISITENL